MSQPRQPPDSMLTAEQAEAALPFLGTLPHPALWILHDCSVCWMNGAASRTYTSGGTSCYALTHGYDEACERAGERCPKRIAETLGRADEVIHAHVVRAGATEVYRVLAVPIVGGGVLEVHFTLGEGLSRDPVSGLFRRERWLEIAQRGRALLVRLRQPYSVLFVDLDRFKLFNDRYGHLAGDDVLRGVAQTIQAHLRMSDTAGRFGGEELVVFMPHTGEPEALAVAERLRAAVAASRLPLPDDLARITISIGVHTANADEPLEEAVSRADRAMYSAKAIGRNRVLPSRPN